MKRPKFGNKKTQRNGMVFDSKKEADRWDQLKLLERVGRIRNLERQVKYELRVNGVLIATYKADFVYEEFEVRAPSFGKAARRVEGAMIARDHWTKVVEDSKGYPNDRWPMKKKLMKACHGIAVRET